MAGDDDLRWLDPDDQMGLWGHQGDPLSIGDLARIAEMLPPTAPIKIVWHDASGANIRLTAAHIDAEGQEGRPSSIVITVV